MLKNNAYIEVVTVDSTAYAPLLLWWQLLLGELEHQRLPAYLISTVKGKIHQKQFLSIY